MDSDIDLTLNGITAEGFGVGRAEKLAVFVAHALPGDRLTVRLQKRKKSYAYGTIVRIITPSPHRVPPVCPISARCGGCTWQHCAYPAQLAFKKQIVTDAFARIARMPDAPVLDVRGMDNPDHYRNKAQFPVGKDGIGFYEPRSHRVVPVAHCHIQHPAHEAVLRVVSDFIKRYGIAPYDGETHTGLLRHIIVRTGFQTGEVMVVLVVNGTSLPHHRPLTKALSGISDVTTVVLNHNTARTAVILGERYTVLSGSGFITDCIGPVTYRISAGAFFQVNPIQTKVLYDTVLALGAFTGQETVIDAHAGIGGIGLYVAHAAKQVFGVELVAEAHRDAVANAALNGINNATFYCGAAESLIPSMLCNGPKADIIILDPPRKGCAPALLDAIAAERVPAVIYVSCDPATLARDVQSLHAKGFTMEKIQPVDLFPMTAHVECVALLSKSRSGLC